MGQDNELKLFEPQSSGKFYRYSIKPSEKKVFISKFPKMTIPQSIIPEESSNFLYSNNDYLLNRSLGDENNNMKNALMEVEESEEAREIIFEENN